MHTRLCLVAALAALGCEAIAGIDERTLAPPGGEGASAGSATSGGGQAGAGASGAAAGGAASGGAGAAGGGGGGIGGGTPGGATLLVSVENLSPNSGAEGDVLTCRLSDNQCELLSPFGITAQPFAIAWVPPDTIAIAGRGEVQRVDANTGGIAWTMAVAEDLPADIFPLVTTGGAIFAAAYEMIGVSQIRAIHAYSALGVETDTWMLNGGGFPLGLSWVSMTQVPSSPTNLFALRVGESAMREVDAEDQIIVDPGLTSALSLQTIHAIHDGNRLRVAWVEGLQSDSIVYLTAGGTIAGPITCATNGQACTFEHAIPDPTSATDYLALCSDNGSVVRQLVRLSEGSGQATPCEVIYDSATLGTGFRLSKLAVRQ